MRIGGRLVLLLAVPLVALLALTGYGIASGWSDARTASRIDARSDLAFLAHSLAADLQEERHLVLTEGRTEDELRRSIESTSEAIEVRARSIGGQVDRVARDVARGLPGVSRVAEAGLGGRVALRTHTRAVDELLDLATLSIDPGGDVDDAAATTTDHLARARAASSEERDLLVVLREEVLELQSFQRLTALAGEQESYAALAVTSSAGLGDMSVRIDRIVHSMRATDVLRREAFLTGAERLGEGPWGDGLEDRIQELAELQQRSADIAAAQVDELARASRSLLVGAALLALAVLLVSALVLRRAVRTIARPLEDLAVQAEDVARTRLREAVAAQQHHGREELHLPSIRAAGAAEVHELAAAFNEVQDTALRLAGEQAVLRVNQAEALTNLGRRNQTLLARQLDFISSLEKRETDPAFLEHLFKLDHLASRMRRNAESLLILAGSETPRRRRNPAPVSEVVRAAMSEVEEFERIRIGRLGDATLAGPAVIDLVHLLAELVENALGFSPPDTTVEIEGRPLGQGGYQFAVVDHGVGMPDVDLLAANRRMSGADELDGMPTRYLGQYVVAKLAAKIGAMVRVQPSSGGRGVTALVNLPSEVVLGGPDRSSVATPFPGSRASRQQGPEPFAPGRGVPAAAREVEVWAEIAEPASLPAADLVGFGRTPQLPGLDPELRHHAPDPWSDADATAPTPEEHPTSSGTEVPPSSAPVPPAAPTSVPTQPDWAPPTGPSPAEPPQTVPSPSRAGGLARRVPGASMAGRDADAADAATGARQRSATEVRSTLASFQAGRRRGLGGSPATAAGALHEHPQDDVSDIDAPLDGRSTT